MNGVYYRRAESKARIHSENMKDKANKNNLLSILNITFVSFAGVANNIVSIVGADNKVFSAIFSIILYGSLMVTGIQKYFHYDEDIEKHRVSYILYSTLCQNIEDETIPPQYIRSQFQLLKAMEPSIPDDVDIHIATENADTPRDIALEFELNRMDRSS